MAHYNTGHTRNEYRFTGKSRHSSRPDSMDEGVTQAAKAYDGTVWLVVAMETKRKPGQECSKWAINRVYPSGKIAIAAHVYPKKDAAMAAAQKEADQINGTIMRRAYEPGAANKSRNRGA